jgi:hypothetical protein
MVFRQPLDGLRTAYSPREQHIAALQAPFMQAGPVGGMLGEIAPAEWSPGHPALSAQETNLNQPGPPWSEEWLEALKRAHVSQIRDVNMPRSRPAEPSAGDMPAAEPVMAQAPARYGSEVAPQATRPAWNRQNMLNQDLATNPNPTRGARTQGMTSALRGLALSR